MIKYATITNEETKACNVGVGTNSAFYKSIGMVQMDVEQSDKDNSWYLVGYAPMNTSEELSQMEDNRVSALEQTRGDVFRAVFKAFGVKRDALRAMIENCGITEEFTEDDKELALIDFDEGLNFIRGSKLIDIIRVQLGVLSIQMDNFFETNDYLELTKL